LCLIGALLFFVKCKNMLLQYDYVYYTLITNKQVFWDLYLGHVCCIVLRTLT
jgi:hypothetical protein